MKIHVIFGQTGEYSDHTDWPVKGFLDAAKAEVVELELTKAAKKHHDAYKVWIKENAGRRWDANFYAEHPEPKYAGGDTRYQHDYTGTDYYTIEVDVEE